MSTVHPDGLPPIPDNPPFEELPNHPALVELKSRARWVAWKWGYSETGKLTKPPINPHTGNKASTDKPATWGTYEQAAQRARANGLPGGWVYAWRR